MAVRAAKAVGFSVAGVDLIRSNHGSCVIEINSSPGLEGIETISGVDVASHIISILLSLFTSWRVEAAQCEAAKKSALPRRTPTRTNSRHH